LYIAGLTGGTGAGKSSAARRFETHGIPVVDADRIGHELIAPGGEAEADVIAAFGGSIVSCGRIDRGRLGARVFADPESLSVLNGIMKPRIAAAIGQRCFDLAAAGAAVCIVDAALLGDSGVLEPWLACLVLVSCPEEDRVARLVAHRGMTEAGARERVRAQVDPERKRPLARWVIENVGTLEALHARVDEVATALLSDGWSCGHGKL